MKYQKIYAIKFRGEVVYVGQTGDSIDARFFKHIRNGYGNYDGGSRVPKLYDHMKKNQPSDYTFELLEIVREEEKHLREQFWIEHYKTRSKCNTTSGGIAAQGPDHYLYGVKGGCEAAVKASVSARLGKPLSAEHKRKKSETYKRNRASHKHIRKIRCKQTGRKWETLSDCAAHFGVSLHAITNRIDKEAPERVRNKTLGKFTFEYI